MSVAPLKILHVVLPSVEGDVYTASASVQAQRVWIANISNNPATVSLSIGGQRILGAEQIAANKHLNEPIGIPLAAGDTIRGVSSIAGALVLLVTGLSLG